MVYVLDFQCWGVDSISQSPSLWDETISQSLDLCVGSPLNKSSLIIETSGPELIKLFSCSRQLNMKF